jgi:hypothetical protein
LICFNKRKPRNEVKIMTALPAHCCTTPQARFSYFDCFEPRPNLNGVLQYSVTLLLPKTTTDLTTINAAVNAAAQIGMTKKWGGVQPQNLQLPVKDGDVYAAQKPDKRAMYVGHWYIKCNQNPDFGKPIILDINRARTEDKNAVQSGDYGTAVVEFVAYSNKGNDGITAIPKVILKTSEGERFGGGVSSTDAISALGGEVPAVLAAAAGAGVGQPVTTQAVNPQQPIINPNPGAPNTGITNLF